MFHDTALYKSIVDIDINIYLKLGVYFSFHHLVANTEVQHQNLAALTPSVLKKN